MYSPHLSALRCHWHLAETAEIPITALDYLETNWPPVHTRQPLSQLTLYSDPWRTVLTNAQETSN